MLEIRLNTTDSISKLNYEIKHALKTHNLVISTIKKFLHVLFKNYNFSSPL